MGKLFKRAFEALGHAETLSAILHTEFVRNTLLPTALAMTSGAAGVVGGVPLMWVIMASTITFASMTIALFMVDALRERKTPQNKLSTKMGFQCDLTPKTIMGNRKERRAKAAQHLEPITLSSNQIDPAVSRTIDKGQLGIEVTNNALFPISCILQSATSELEGEFPPRSEYPKSRVIVPAGSSIRVMDDAIEMDEYPCQKLKGRLDMLVKYGLPGNENFELHIKGSVDVVMQKSGLVSSIVLDLLDATKNDAA